MNIKKPLYSRGLGLDLVLLVEASGQIFQPHCEVMLGVIDESVESQVFQKISDQIKSQLHKNQILKTQLLKTQVPKTQLLKT